MAKIKYRNVRLSQANKDRLETINGIIEEYQEQGYVLTLRQLYYQLVSRDVIPNKQTEYSKLSTLLKEGRMGGIVDWDAIEDRLRKPSSPSAWDNPQSVMRAVLAQYQKPRMKGQTNYVEVWVEKDALSGVLKRVTEKYHIPILVNRGYSSASAMFDSYHRFKDFVESFTPEEDDVNQDTPTVTILYLGDFDPSGMDMIRDIEARTMEFADRDFGEDFVFKIIPVALTRAQIKQYKPPPNPAKRTDPRAKDFIREHGATSWEVDALPPDVLNALLTTAIEKIIDVDKYEDIVASEVKDKAVIRKIIADLNKDRNEEDNDD